MSIAQLIDDLPEILSDDELRAIKRPTPPASPTLAAVIESVWLTRWGSVPVCAAAELARLRDRELGEGAPRAAELGAEVELPARTRPTSPARRSARSQARAGGRR